MNSDKSVEFVVRGAATVVALSCFGAMSFYHSRRLEKVAPQIDGLFKDLSNEPNKPAQSTTLPGASQAQVLETKDFIFNFVKEAKDDPKGLLLIFSKKEEDGEAYAKINSKGKLIEGSSSVGSTAISQLRKTFPNTLERMEVEKR